MELNELEHVISEPDFPVPPEHQFRYSPDELLQKMGEAAWVFEQANRKLQKIAVTKSVREKKTSVILSSRRFDLLQNEKLKAHLIECFDVDPKFRITGELFSNFIYVEHQALFDEFTFYELLAKQAEKEHEMWQKQLGWHQSEIKKEVAEMQVLGGRT